MSTPSPIVLVLGAGPNIGQSVARAFAAKGYRTALTSRKATDANNTADEIHIQADFTDPGSVVNAFSKVNSILGMPPSVVVYNASMLGDAVFVPSTDPSYRIPTAAGATLNPPDNPLALALSDFERSLTINATSAFVAAQQAAQGFAKLPDTASRTFIYTGNILNTATVIPPLMDLGVGKSAMSHVVLASAKAYGGEGFKFYYADERKPDGGPAKSDIDGEAHAKHYIELAETNEQGPWQQTFVKGVGYKAFDVRFH